MRIGLIGLGRIGAFHATTLAGLEHVDELVVTDPVAAAVDAVTGRLPSARAVDSPEALLASGVDGVAIAAATNTHAGLIRAAVAKGVPTFCEKPIAGTIAESIAVQEAVAGSDVPVQIGYPRRFDPAFVAAREAARSGSLGRITTVRSTTLDPAPPPADYLAVSGGLFRDCSVHDFDAVRWVTGQEVVEVYAVGAVDPDAPEEMYAAHGDHSSASVLLTLSDGTIGVVSNTRTNGRGYDVRLEVHGVRDAVAAGLDEGLPLRSTQPGDHLAERPGPRVLHGPARRGLPRRARRLHPGGGRSGRQPVHRRRRDGHGVDRRGRDPLGPRAPPGDDRGGPVGSHPLATRHSHRGRRRAGPRLRTPLPRLP